MEKFQIPIHDRVGEIRNFSNEFQIFHTTDEEKCEILPNLEEFPQERLFLRGEKLSKRLARWRKNDKYQVCPNPFNIFMIISS